MKKKLLKGKQWTCRWEKMNKVVEQNENCDNKILLII